MENVTKKSTEKPSWLNDPFDLKNMSFTKDDKLFTSVLPDTNLTILF